MFGGYGQRAMSLSSFVPLSPGHDEDVHVTDFLEVWARSRTSVRAVDVGPGTSISGPIGFAGGECSERRMGGQGGLPATPPDQEVGMSDDLEDDHPRAPLKPGLQGSRRQGLFGESTPRGGGDGERLQQGSESTTPRRLVERIGAFVRGMQVAEVSPGDHTGGSQVREVCGSDETTRRARPAPAQLQMELSQEREASGNVADWEDAYNHRSLYEFLVDTIASVMIDCYERKDMRYTKPIFVLTLIVAPPERGEPAVRVLPGDFDSSQPEKYWYYPVCGQHNARAAMKVKDHPVFEYYNLCKWPFRPIYFPDDELDGYAHVSCEDNMKDKKNPPRLQVLSMQNIRNIWKIKGKPRVVLDNASKKKDEVRKWVQLMALAMKKTPYTPLWNLSTKEKKRKEWAEKLRYYLPLAMADDSVFALGEKFYEEWSNGKLLASDGRRWTEKPATHEEVSKPGLSTVIDSQGLKKHVWYVKVDDPLLKKGKGKPKKGTEEKTYYVQVPELDVHCWKELVDLTDREKKRSLNGILNLNVVWVQTSSKKLAEQGKFSVKKMVDIIKMDRIMLRLWHYVEFEYEEMDKREWNANFTFFRSKKQLLEEQQALEREQEIFHGHRGAVAEDNAAALRRKQKVTPTDVEEKSFKSLTFADIGNLTQRGDLYKDGERNPNQLCNQLLFFYGVADVVLFLGKPHAQVVWSLLHQGRHVLVVDGDTTQLEYTVQYVTHEVSSKAYPCDFPHVVVEPVYDPNKDMFFKLTPKKRRQVYSFLYGEQPRLRFEPQYVVRKEVAIAVLQGYHGARVVKRKSRGKDDEGDGEGGGQRGTGGRSEQRSTKQWSPGHAGGGKGKKGSREKKKPRSVEKTKHHTGDEQGSDVDRDEDGGVLAVTGSTSMETGNAFRPGWVARPFEQDPVISSTSAIQFTDVVGGTVIAKNGTFFAQLQKRLADCLGSIRISETTLSSGTQCLPGSETTTYHGSGSDKLDPSSVSPQKEVRINPNREASTVERAQQSTKLERVVRVFENPGGEIRIHLNQEDVSAMTDNRCQDAVMLCMEVHKELQAGCPTEVELATSFNVEPRTFGVECLVTVRAELAVLSDSPVKTDTSSALETAGARMNLNQGPVSMSLPDAALETTVIRIHPRHTDEGLQLAGVEGCRLLTTLDKDDSADDRIDPTLSDVGLEQPVQPGNDDPVYSGLHDEVMGEGVLKKSSDAVGDRFLYLSDDDKDTAHEDKKLRGGEVLLDIHGTLSTIQYDTVAMEKTRPVDVVDVDALCPETNTLKLPVADVVDFHHRDGDEFMPSAVIDADISNLSSFPVGLEHVVAASTRTGAPIVLGLPSVDSSDVEAKPGKH
ncbi:hypothetical protein CBR_g11929 [Chara braunii]|uniref:Uncharacterized protein n=1 Tax=Chara braunii TaxID=69332 RepID=A0A388KQP6_CHABU|nr:hypothetical protein CBR_g11929 [Chara braunii]|eukprot:GBG72352.1 hypothetical protein CBR_g11929 [Chara braunii]